MARAMGRYQLVRPLARGGMAEVFLARRRAGGLEKLLVVKRIRPERAGDARFLELFLREARLSMSLTHGNIVGVFDFGRAGDRVFLAMERIEGKDLASTLARPGTPPLAPVIAAFVGAECCQALAYAHRRAGADGRPLGVVHRDVTPRNVLVSWSGEVKLTDFGIAALAGDSDRALVGTPAYLAPEQARLEVVDARADLYALGLVIRELVTGERARPGDDRDALVAAARAGELAAWPDGVDPDLRAILDRATAADRDARYADAGALLAALDQYIVARRAAEPAEPPAQRLARWMSEAWAGASDDAGDELPADSDVELHSMFDDGDGGDSTARSMAATAAEAPAPIAGAAPIAPPPPATAAPPGWRWRSVALASLGALVVALVALALARSGRGGATGVDAGVTRDAIAADAAIADAADTDAPTIVVADAASDAAPVDAVAVAADARRPIPPPVPRDAAPAVDAAPPVLRTVRINARPWAQVYIDGSPTAHETIATVRLAPGRHRLRFVNPQLGVEREVTIDVPADRDLDHIEDLR